MQTEKERNDNLENSLREEGYFMLVWHDDVLCGLFNYVFTVAVVVDIDYSGYAERFCYDTVTNAVKALILWDGNGDPIAEGFKRPVGRQWEYLMPTRVAK